MRALLFAVFMLAVCAPSQGAAEPDPYAQSDLARQIRADLQRLDAQLRAPGIVAAGIGETADLGGGLTVRPIDIIEDSRCAANVTCIWAGRLRVRVAVSGVTDDLELTLGEPLATPHGAILLAVAKPSAWVGWPADEFAVPPHRFGFRRR